jgi:hypothetical protein
MAIPLFAFLGAAGLVAAAAGGAGAAIGGANARAKAAEAKAAAKSKVLTINKDGTPDWSAPLVAPEAELLPGVDDTALLIGGSVLAAAVLVAVLR